jgi:hypothetical protein
LYEDSNPATLHNMMTQLPVAKAIGKAHKDPWVMRFLAASGDTGLTRVARWVTLLLRVVEPALVAEWRGLLRAMPAAALQFAGFPQDDPKPWFIKNTKQLVDTVVAFAHRGVSQEAFDEGQGFAAFDVEQLYNAIAQDDLESSLHKCLHTAWQWFEAGAPALLEPSPPVGQQAAAMEVDSPTGWLQVFARKELLPRYLPLGEHGVAGLYGPTNPERRKQGAGM